MTIDEAIKTLTITTKSHPHRLFPDFYDAAKLGIEALKVLKTHRTYSYPGLNYLLPGETKD